MLRFIKAVIYHRARSESDSLFPTQDCPAGRHRKLRAESSPDETWQTLVKLHGGLASLLLEKERPRAK